MLSEQLLLLSLGFSVGTIGTLIGAGGGFILVPALLLLYPSFGAETITGVSLAIVFCNALSGSLAYAYKKRIDYRSTVIFSIAAAPGSLLGAYLTSLIPRAKFQSGFGFILILISLYLLIGKVEPKPASQRRPGTKLRVLIDRYGHEHHIAYNSLGGIALSVAAGFLSSLLGIGGGIIHVPALIRLLDFPVHIATATSHSILALTAIIGVAEHYFRGDLVPAMSQIFWLAPGVVVGAQLGAYLSAKINGPWIVRGLAIGLLSVGLRFALL